MSDDARELPDWLENPREPDHQVDPLFIERFSPKLFDGEPLDQDLVLRCFEAARWAPSSFNEQPWRFVYARRERSEDFERLLEVLNEHNRRWARTASVLAVIFARRRLTRNEKPNRVAEFDAGSAWMSLTLQARLLGLYTHGMAGIDRAAAHELLGVPEADYSCPCAFALGRLAPEDAAPDSDRRTPNDRKPLSEIAFEGRFRG